MPFLYSDATAAYLSQGGSQGHGRAQEHAEQGQEVSQSVNPTQSSAGWEAVSWSCPVGSNMLVNGFLEEVLAEELKVKSVVFPSTR